MKKNRQKFWDKASIFYSRFMKKNEAAYSHFVKVLEKYLHKDMKALEIGCGTGELSFLLADKLNDFIATDFSEGMIRACEKKYKHEDLRFQVEDASHLSFEDDSFDLIIIANVLHIVPDMDLVLDEIKRLSKKDGIIFAPIFVYNQKKWNFTIWILENLGFKSYQKFSSEEYLAYLEKKGFQLIEEETIVAKPLNECIVVAKCQ